MHLKYNEYTESQISTFPHMHNIKYLMLNKAALLKNTVHTHTRTYTHIYIYPKCELTVKFIINPFRA